MINYPHKKNVPSVVKDQRHQHQKAIDFGKRGMSFEAQIVSANAYYLASGVAVIHKKPTPIQIVKVDYPKRAAATITEAYFKTPSTTDFNGIYNGIYVDFEAKETTNKTTFPLANVHGHQVKHLVAVAEQKGFAFLLVKFVTLDEIYLLMSDTLHQFWQEYEKGIRKSIKRDEFMAYGTRVPNQTYPSVDYLKTIDQLLNKRR
ncbi:MAG: Holliday junction resolvase RecU [Defluviitaleaceae bacterium]|nr:Holliday junction resolvase RecU [Defluviitaleaceae bacterium]